MVIVDTSVWIDYFRGVEAAHLHHLETVLLSTKVLVGDLIIVELLQGAKSDKSVAQIKKILQLLSCVNMVNERIAYKAAENYRYLRSNGITIRKTMDMLIGTFCIENNLVLLHNDRDFDPMEHLLGLKVLKG